ncbi:hypothetical protein AURANDRAFT_68070 [Aureococcus anophagefferens]|uniref:Uncharacterized protein n=1 Tax=Aureococcus anophagefferens TaxID=44056 RepID=F0YNE1_AURAN|nr:hypothetical protein AURANDRAFT_68070 [Aureococcus anophagefferens]EGB03357.1 hypothetical protein AURANDRAFT_68070 [Aureococcus anophagefferens]|eukprot:XP_009041930.1 hypothetical protein AURANDRAFT_68070 [Aureococcus anophagefferens]
MSSEEVAELLFTPFIVPYWRRQLGMSRMTWFHYTTIALASNIESRSDKKVGVTEQKIVTPTFMDSGSVDCCPQMEPPAKKPRLPHPKGDPEVAAQNKEIQAQRKVAARKISRQAERNEAHMQKFSLPIDGFYLHKLDESVVKDAVASYHKVKEGFAEKKRTNGWTTYFGTDTTAQAKRSTMGEVVLATEENVDQQIMHTDHEAKKGKEEEIGFIVIPVTEAGTNLCVSRGSHKVEYCKKEGDQCIPADFSNDAPPIEIPFGYAMMCSRNLAHAGARTGPDQPPDGRPRIHVYCMDKTGSTFPIFISYLFPIYGANLCWNHMAQNLCWNQAISLVEDMVKNGVASLGSIMHFANLRWNHMAQNLCWNQAISLVEDMVKNGVASLGSIMYFASKSWFHHLFHKLSTRTK